VTTDVVMPKLGLTMEEAEIEAWHKSIGDDVSEGEPLLDVSTDKATVEVNAPASGCLRMIYAEVGAAVPVGGRIGLITDTADEPID